LLEVRIQVPDGRQSQDGLSEKEELLEEARSRAADERNLSATTKTAHYAAASMGQPPYVSLSGVGVVVLRRGGWSC